MDLTAGQRLRLNYTLQVGDVSEKVIVTAEAPLVQAVSPEQQETHSTLEVKELPLSRRDWTNLLIVGTGTNVRGSGVVLNGIGAGGFNFTIDGTEASGSSEDSSLNLFGSFNLIKGVSLEAISEVNVNKGIMSAVPTASSIGRRSRWNRIGAKTSARPCPQSGRRSIQPPCSLRRSSCWRVPGITTKRYSSRSIAERR